MVFEHCLSCICLHSQRISKESGDNFDNPKSKETPDIDLEPATGKSNNLDLDCNMIVEVQDGIVKVVKSGGNEGFSPEMEFVVITNLDQLEFYPKDFFKQKNVLIVKWRIKGDVD